ncbi:A/G-specific DNA-adenine glycosylase [Parasphingorhabdus marina DSM 22363]|uniref:Adenine DNA glycosylase n=1 Tax=Parasphingorhabdus marina DSM 22363 TaxID=1123272 RepID=A0A1N6HD89_9SPHN|nr:A/G-specific adenine glycosylase [Parasphingorhabdus marina]SIO17750.1 A/G-specific DNA-adenine glycosylase [Parasphingorhabdus marina DSM 22363]
MGVDKITGEAAEIAAKISAHYVDNARQLPWRVPPHRSQAGERPDPYHVWLSEIMLQQTTVAAVIGYFETFIRRWPTVTDMAAARESDILAAWAGLGYYARARNLFKCATYVTEKRDGIFPQTESELLELPGIGPYTAAAIAAIAFGQRAVVVDANIERLVARLHAISTPLPAGKKAIRAAMDDLTPEDGAGDFAQACMDIGASVCSARSPKCAICPVRSHCRAHATGKMEEFPVKPPKKAKPVRTGRFFWIESAGNILLVTRPGKGMLAGMRALPDDNWAAQRNGHGQAPFQGNWQIHENVVQHSFTHFSLEVDLAVYHGDKIAINSDESRLVDLAEQVGHAPVWWPLAQLPEAGLPTLFAKSASWAMKRKKKTEKELQ